MSHKKKKHISLLYFICILTFILNIVCICANGATLLNSICGWGCAIMWCVDSWAIYLIGRHRKAKDKEFADNLIAFIKEQEQEIRRLEKKNEE